MKTQPVVIVCIDLSWSSFPGGQALHLAERLAREGRRVTVLCAIDRGEPLAEGVERIKMPRLRVPRTLNWRRWFVHWQAETRRNLGPHTAVSLTPLVAADIIVPTQGWAVDAARALRQLRAPLPARIGAALASVTPSMRYKIAAQRRALADTQTRRCVTFGRQVADGLARAAGPAPIDHIQRVDATPVFSGVDPTPRATRERRGQLARAWNIPDAAAWLVLPFRAPRIEGLEPMLLALKVLVDGGADAVLLLAGQARYTHLAWIAQLGLRDHIRFIGWPDEPQALLPVADIVVSPVAHDPAGWAVHLALELGLPVVTTQGSGAADRARLAGQAVLPNPLTAETLAGALGSMIQASESAPESTAESTALPPQRPSDPSSAAAHPARPLTDVVWALIDNHEPPD